MAFTALYYTHPTQQDLQPRHLSTDALADVLLAFFSYLAGDLRLSHMNIDTVSSGLKFTFRINRIPTAAFDDAAVTALRRSFRSNPLNQPVLRGKRLPYTLNMVRHAVEYNMNLGTMQAHMVATGLLLAFFCLLRASEYAATTADVHHAVRAGAVEFLCILPGTTAEVFIPAHKLRVVPGVSYACVRVVRITIHTAKNIRANQGVPLWFSAQPEAGSAAETLNFTHALFQWTMATTLTEESQFCSFVSPAGSYVPLTYTMMVDTIKLCATAFGFDPARFASHSLRIGGATQLAANGASQELIQMMGRWRSAPVCLDYQHASSQSYDLMLQLLLAPGFFSENDIRMGLCLPRALPRA